jgi:hypothetical protein
MNVAKSVGEFLDKLHSFNGVRIEYIDRESTWHEQYAIFTIGFDIYPGFMDETNEYTEVIVDERKLYKDFEQALRKVVGECKIKHYPSCNEWEIQGPKCKAFFKEHADALEELAMKEGHTVFECEK